MTRETLGGVSLVVMSPPLFFLIVSGNRLRVTKLGVEMAKNNTESIDLASYAEKAYLEYAMSVVKGRALPAVSDGQKPVQRRILYAMHDMGLYHNSKPVKSARVVGEILGKYHPHGDSSAYEAMVRMAQEFTLRYPLVDGQGNFGSRDGDSAAAMRYTEARLTPISELLLGELDKGTVAFKENYDGSETEPVVLPARLPFCLLNGASGIAVGLATEIPPHNLKDVSIALLALIDNPKITSQDLVPFIKAPDFPGGGQIISQPEIIAEAYVTGRGSVRVRAIHTIEKHARGQWSLVVNELPPGVSSAKILSEIEEYTNPKIKAGKKALSQDQIQMKQLFLAILDAVRDESDSDHPIRLVFEPKSSRIDQHEFITAITAHTSLEVNVSINLVAINNAGAPKTMSIKDMLVEFMDARYNAVFNRMTTRLQAIRKRLHILEGRKIAFVHLDKVIEVIRESDDPKTDLMAKFKMSAEQAEDILEIRLRQLSRLEGFKLDKEIETIQAEIAQLEKTTKSPAKIIKVIRKEIEDDTAKFGDKRRTLIKPDEKTTLVRTIKDEPVTVVVTKNNWIRLGTIAVKGGDTIAKEIETRTIYPIFILDSNGKVYNIMPEELVGLKSEGVPITSLINIGGGRIVSVFSNDPQTPYVFASDAGYGFAARLEALQTRLKAGKQFITVHGDERPVVPVLYQKGHLVCVTEKGRMTAFPSGDLPVMKGGRGLQLIQRHTADDKVTCLGISKDKTSIELTYITNRSTQAKLKVDKKDFISKRGARGKQMSRVLEVVSIE